MAIISGLNLSAVSRLKTVREDKANKVCCFNWPSITQLKICVVHRSFNNLKILWILKRPSRSTETPLCQPHPPRFLSCKCHAECIDQCLMWFSYSGVYLSDLTFMEDGNSDTLEGLINMNKRRMIYNVIESVHQFQLVRVTLKMENSTDDWPRFLSRRDMHLRRRSRYTHSSLSFLP